MNLFSRKRLFISMGVIAILVVSIMAVSFAKNGKFALATKEKLEEFFGAQGQRHYNYIPNDVIDKHKATIEEVNVMMAKLPEGMTTKDANFSLNYYEQIIRIGIIPYIIENKQFTKEVNDLLEDICKYTKDNHERENQKEPKPTVVG